MLGHGHFGKVSTRYQVRMQCDSEQKKTEYMNNAMQVYRGVLNKKYPVAVKILDPCTAADRIRFCAVSSRMFHSASLNWLRLPNFTT
jgi:hypothetical protein